MTAAQRRTAIISRLTSATAPISASIFAKELGVSRQIVVGDIALLRASGTEIVATPRGYHIVSANTTEFRGMVACQHGFDETLQNELFLVVDNGGTVEDVAVANPLYGELRATLQISNRYDATEFYKRAQEEPNSLLSSMTGGAHLHTISCPNEACFLRIKAALKEANILYEK